MLLALMVSLAVAAPAPAPGRAPSIATAVTATAVTATAVTATDDEPRIKVWLNHDDYRRGDKARVNVKVAEDGYLIVLRADAEGRVRVLFPLDPSDDAFGRGGETIEVRGRGDREAFYVDEREGTGLVLAARSAVPFKFDEFVRGDHWDYRVLDARQAGDDKEAALLDIVQRMTPDGHFDYDDVKYYVSSQQAYYDYYPSTLSVGFGWGWPYRYGYFSSCYDSFYSDPFYCGGFALPLSPAVHLQLALHLRRRRGLLQRAALAVRESAERHRPRVRVQGSRWHERRAGRDRAPLPDSGGSGDGLHLSHRRHVHSDPAAPPDRRGRIGGIGWVNGARPQRSARRPRDSWFTARRSG